MSYLERFVEKRRQPALLADGKTDFHSMLVLAVNYHQLDLPAAVLGDPSRGIIARYAWGDDYHEIMRPALYALDDFIRTQTGRTTEGKALVDTGPVLERDLGRPRWPRLHRQKLLHDSSQRRQLAFPCHAAHPRSAEL